MTNVSIPKNRKRKNAVPRLKIWNKNPNVTKNPTTATGITSSHETIVLSTSRRFDYY
jgi:hypothetical protein